MVKLLLDAGADIDAQSVNGGTPLMRAIETSQKTMVKLLLEKGWDTQKVYTQYMFLASACVCPSIEI